MKRIIFRRGTVDTITYADIINNNITFPLTKYWRKSKVSRKLLSFSFDRNCNLSFHTRKNFKINSLDFSQFNTNYGTKRHQIRFL